MRDRNVRSIVFTTLVALLPIALGLVGVFKVQAGEEIVNFLTHHLNNARTGWNDHESVLNPGNVSGLRKLGQYNDINGQIYAAPLFYHVNDRDLLFVATETNWIYALDVTGDTPELVFGRNIDPPLDQFTFESKIHGGCGDINPWHGITGTGVIDPATNTWYFVTLTTEKSFQIYKAHAVNILTGQEVDDPRWPVVIAGEYGPRAFQAFMQTQRGALTLENGMLYIPFSSRCDAVDWQGWIFGIDITNPGSKPQYVFNTAPDGNGAGVWGQGGLSIDPSKALQGAGYLVTGNGTVNYPPIGMGQSFGMSVLRINLLDFAQPFSYMPRDFYTIPDYPGANARDTDLGGSSVLVVPEQPDSNTPRLLFTAGKDGRVYLINRDSLGGLSTPGQPTELQFLRVSRGQRVAPSYYEDDATGGHFMYVTTGENRNTFGTYTDWEDSPVNMAAQGEMESAAQGTGPSLAVFNDRLYVAWVNNTAEREIMIKSSPNAVDWSSEASDALGGFAAPRTSPSLASFGDALFVAWVENGKNQIKIKSSADGMTWSNEQTLDTVFPTTYASLGVFQGKLYVAYIGNTLPYQIQVRSTNDGKTWSDPVSVYEYAGQTVPMGGAPYIIGLSNQLYAFWLRHREDRTIVFKSSSDGQGWPGDPRSFGESADFRSGLSGFVLNTIIENDPTLQSGPLRLHILFLANARNPLVFVKSIGTNGLIEAGNLNTNERARAESQTGAAVFRGRPWFAFVGNNPNTRQLLLKPGAVGYRGGGLIAFRLTVDAKTGASRLYPAWTSGRIPGEDNPPTAFDYLPGMPFVTSNGRRDGLVWVTEGLGANPILRAYNAATGQELFNSETTGDPNNRITCGGRKFVQTVVVNGRVFLGTNCVMVYGIRK